MKRAFEIQAGIKVYAHKWFLDHLKVGLILVISHFFGS